MNVRAQGHGPHVREDLHVSQPSDDLPRRWFSSPNLDLIVWFNVDRTFAGFELCYDKLAIERSISWRPHRGFSHGIIDNGELRSGRYKAAPVLIPDGNFDAHRIYSEFLRESPTLPRDIALYVLQHLKKHPDLRAP